MKANTMTRTKLSDITNTMNQQLKPTLLVEKLNSNNATDKNYIDQLVKENMALVKSLREKNKIIELTGIEIQKLRTFLEKMQSQNRSLAQSNSHMLAELNLGKDRLKVLQHELACKEAILKAKDSELKEQKMVNIQITELQETDKEEANGVDSEPGHEESSRPLKTNKRGRPSKRRSLGSQVVSQLQTKKEAVGSKRHCNGIQSASAMITHQEQSENSVEMHDETICESQPSTASSMDKQVIGTGFESKSNAVVESRRISSGRLTRRSVAKVEIPDEKNCDSKQLNASSVDEQVNGIGYESKSHEEESQRTSTGRPTRRSVVKVQSYKEVPLNTKMRRPLNV